jgi:hypothetical protein
VLGIDAGRIPALVMKLYAIRDRSSGFREDIAVSLPLPFALGSSIPVAIRVDVPSPDPAAVFIFAILIRQRFGRLNGTNELKMMAMQEPARLAVFELRFLATATLAVAVWSTWR